MKQSLCILCTLALLCSGCGTSQSVSGDPNAIMAGAAIGGNVGSAIGGLIGESSHGWRGGYRGSAIGTILGTIAGAAIGNAVSTPKQSDEESYRIERTQPSPSRPNDHGGASAVIDRLRIHNIRFIDDNRDHILTSGENSKVVFEIINEGSQTANNVIPVVRETTGMKRIYISPSVMIEQIEPQQGMKYTAHISAGERIKEGEICIRLAIADEYGEEYDWQEFELPTQR